MDSLYLVAAGLGGAVIVCQFLLSAAGVGHDHDAGGDHDTDHDADKGHGNVFLGLLTVRSAAAGVAFFGLGGLTARYFGQEPLPAFSAAAFGGFAALYAVAALMKAMRSLRHDGTARIETAVGRTGTVYLVVPGANAGPGKVTLTVQDRTVECEAVTAAPAGIPTGSPVRVVRVVGPNRVEVEPLPA
jgi:membrane protein implicated in regulation of membrane protease activity